MERAVLRKLFMIILMENFHKSLTANDEKAALFLRCVQDHKRLYPNCNKKKFKK